MYRRYIGAGCTRSAVEFLKVFTTSEQLPPTHIICNIPIVIKNITTIIILIVTISSLTENKMEFGWCLKGVMHRDDER